ncbi:inner membrane peptidase Atp23 [Schizosaccharomyces japonicus yFS275]|uniref:Mitochondrial inner membrane protease ATP23 n=1 Tax=Schizosaccharomyces japonicus (strain yFS275 / FY16936) TaxID=402676 RepID=B6JZ16_SCHJY|nr:inner membrane peptidase Atp23 [Schizosaccharomyces japonicus yFS275]EEB06784.2 inner membrane peptidase Atp23 [Schizosaccharomyces japonicus yFS275]
MDCEKIRDLLLSNSPICVFLTDAIKRLNGGKDVVKDMVQCVQCDEQQTGGYTPDEGITLCANHLFNKKMAENTLAHEMIHMHDDKQFQIDWLNLEHHACAEIRASSLSGECRWTKEWAGGNIKTFSKHHQACVKRRATQSVLANPKCTSKEEAERVVNKVFEACFRDTRPFEKIY